MEEDVETPRGYSLFGELFHGFEILIITESQQGIRSSATLSPRPSRDLWEASPLGDLTAEELRPEAGSPQGVP
jgi:hypothetical protein